MHELRADGRAVDTAGFVRIRTGEVKLGKCDRRKVLIERIKLCLQVAPATEGIKNLFALECGLF